MTDESVKIYLVTERGETAWSHGQKSLRKWYYHDLEDVKRKLRNIMCHEFRDQIHFHKYDIDKPLPWRIHNSQTGRCYNVNEIVTETYPQDYVEIGKQKRYRRGHNSEETTITYHVVHPETGEMVEIK